MNCYTAVPEGTSLAAHEISANARKLLAAVSGAFTTKASLDGARNHLRNIRKALETLEELLDE